jgi:2-polyprenyl-3-methyl-5-hydroxy-6-metoxy-1,4-benzoquinol methylase
MERVPEPELMSDKEQAIAYANADFEEPHNHFIELLKEAVAKSIPDSGLAVDLGCGAADISIRFANAFPNYQIDGLDGSSAMLAEGTKAIEKNNLSNRINLIQTNLQDATLKDKNYSIIFCNAMLHHLHDPSVLWNLIKTATDNPVVFVMDLMRPETEVQVDALVKEYAKDEPEVLKRDFFNSLKAAFTPAEVDKQLRDVELEGFKVSVVSDRHFTVYRK